MPDDTVPIGPAVLYAPGTQTVFGEGTPGARVVLVGEEPADKEDRAGRPFVGPAGQLLDRALDSAGIDRREAYVTNDVKHFKWQPRGKRRIPVDRGRRGSRLPAFAGRRAGRRPARGHRRAGCRGDPGRCHREVSAIMPPALRPRTLARGHGTAAIAALYRARSESSRSNIPP